MSIELWARVRSLWLGLVRRADVEASLDEELRHHVEMRADALERMGIPRGAALQQARREFGSTARYRDESLRARGLHYFDEIRFSRLDVKLGVRMLVKYPGLALVGGLAMAVAIAFGALFDVLAGTVTKPVPFEEGDRVVIIENINSQWSDQERRILHDFVVWRNALTTVEDVSAFRLLERNLITAGGVGEAHAVAEMTASAFRLTRVAPLMGRTLSEDDERASLSPAVVIGYNVWHRVFRGDSSVLGRELQLGDTRYTVVGVMPEGFRFPINHELWVSLRPTVADYEPLSGPQIYVAARLGRGATLESAQAELTSIGERMAAEFPQTHLRLRPRVAGYTRIIFDDLTGWESVVVRFLVTLLLAVVCATVATLVYARTATRRSEIAVRSALGAARRRIIAQLFVEALVLTGLAAAIGLVAAHIALERVEMLAVQFLDAPFWMDFSLSLETIAYVAVLTIVAAIVVGVLPALKATGRDMQEQLRQLGGGTGLRFGRTWTMMIMLQVAAAVALLPIVVSAGETFLRFGVRQPGYATGQLLTARLHMDRETSPSEAELVSERARQRHRVTQAEFVRRLENEPSVAAVIPLEGVPGQEPTVPFEMDNAESVAGMRVGTRRIDVHHFDVLEVPVVAGRALHAADTDSSATAVLVNMAFVEQVLRGGRALGRRIRYLRSESSIAAGRWYEIVGVVADYPSQTLEPDQVEAKVFHAMQAGELFDRFAVRVRGAAPESFAPRMRAIAMATDPNILVRDVRTLDTLLREEHETMRLTAIGIAALTLSVILLSAAGIFALMNFTVAQRRREIGIRAALGANPRRLLLAIFARALSQLGAGVLAGTGIAVVLMLQLRQNALWSLAAIAGVMLAVGLVATVFPARSGLRIQPTEALRSE